jgi:Ser/Thr protein kinase RdoA (MazF antagonist)
MPSHRLDWIHALMARARSRGLNFVPSVFPVAPGFTWLEHDGRLWDLTEWMPGAADYHLYPTRQRLHAASHALAELHLAWRPAEVTLAPCPAIQRRLDAGRTLAGWVSAGWQPSGRELAEPLQSVLARAWQLLKSRDGWIQKVLEPHRLRCWPLQPCLCDIWHDHVFFLEDRITAIVDYGGVKVDHVAVDLARLLGSLAGDDPASQEIGLDAYSLCQSLSVEDRHLVHLLDQTGVVAAMIAWLGWLYHQRRVFESPSVIADRIANLTTRAECATSPERERRDG